MCSRLTPLLLAAALGCGQPADDAVTSSGATIAREGGQLWLTSPDDDRVEVLDADSLAVARTIEVPGAPDQLLRVEGGWLVSLAGAAELAFVPLEGAVARVPVPCGGTRGLAALPGGDVLTTCPNDDRVLRLRRAEGWQVAEEVALPGRPGAIATLDARAFVALERGGAVVELDEALVERARWPLAPDPGFAATRLQTLIATGRGGVIAAYQRVDHDSDRERAPERGGYGSVEDGAPRIEPRLFARCAGRYARFDGGLRVLSGPSALAHANGRLWIVNQFTGRVAVVRCAGEGVGSSEAEAELLAVFRVGAGARGVVVDAAGETAWVDVGFDHAVARLSFRDARPGAVAEPALERVRATGERRLTAPAERGRRLFFDATDTHLTPSGVVTCGTCHPGGGEDGLAWFLHTPGVPRKVRRTPPVWDAAGRPLHWDAEFADGATLSGATIRELMEGDGLLVDLDAMAAFMAELPPPPGAPREGIEEGRALFEARCAGCHPGGRSDGLRHATLPASEDPDARLPDARTPDLRGVRARPPYFHDGRAPDLDAALQVPGPHEVPDAGERSELRRYLETL